MKANRMFRSSTSLMLALAVPGAVIAFTVLGLQTVSLMSQLAFSCAGVALVFSALIFLPYFFERHSQMRTLVERYDAIQMLARIRVQRSQYYTLNRALSRHQLRGRGALASVRSF